MEIFMSKNYELSVARWHKVAERLSRNYVEITQGIRNTFTNTHINGFLGDSQIARLKNNADNEFEKLHLAFALQDTLIIIRQAIGEVNANNGVTNLLAEHDALTRRLKLLESILTAQGTEMVGFEELPALPKQVVSEDRFDRSLGSVKVKMLDSAKEAHILKEVESLRAKVYVLADRISDLNCQRLALEIPEHVAQTAGL
jgi:hypothetical protein